MTNDKLPQVFISHSSSDRAFVEDEVIALLRSHGVGTWYSTDNIHTAADWGARIVEALGRCEWFLVVLSPQAIKSEWVKSEVNWAFRNRRGRVIPVLYQDCDQDKLHLSLARIQHVDFRKITPDSQQRLLAALTEDISVVSGNASDSSDGYDEAGTRTGDTEGTQAFSREPRAAESTLLRPVFHCGTVVPPQYFIGRESELDAAARLIQHEHSFLLVGRHRDGKTSLIKMLIARMLNDPNNRILPVYRNVQMWPTLSIHAYLEHTVIGLIGAICDNVFGYEYDLLPVAAHDSSELPARLREDAQFRRFLETYQRVRSRTHTRAGEPADPFEMEAMLNDHRRLVDILRRKQWQGCAVFYDEANRLSKEIRVDMLMSHEEALDVPGRTSVYAASPTMADTFAQLRQSFAQRVSLRDFSKDDIRRLLACYYFEDAEKVGDIPVSRDAIDQLFLLSDGRPYDVQRLAQESFNLANEANDAQVTGVHVASAHDALNEVDGM